MKKVTVKVRKPSTGTDCRMSSAGTITSSALRLLAARVATTKVKSSEAKIAANMRSVERSAYSGSRAGSSTTGLVCSVADRQVHLLGAVNHQHRQRPDQAPGRSDRTGWARTPGARTAQAGRCSSDRRRGRPWARLVIAASAVTRDPKENQVRRNNVSGPLIGPELSLGMGSSFILKDGPPRRRPGRPCAGNGPDALACQPRRGAFASTLAAS